VLRVNSPGGSAFASDVMARAIGRLRAAGKAVVVSMGDMAASGGYYISAPGDVIYAEPSTISGSIGVFGFKADVHQLMGTLGLSIESYKRGAHSDYQSPYRSWTDAELKIVMDKIRHIYALFLETVATGRKAQGLTVARVDEIGRGAVWTGALAQGLGLVDKMGGLADAIDDAARRGAVPLGPDQLPDLQVLPPSPSSALRRLVGLGASDDDAPSKLTAGLLGTEGRALLRMVASLALSDPADTGVVARLPYDIDIR